MKTVLKIVGFVVAILGVVLAVTPKFNFAFYAAGIAFLCGLAILLLSKNDTETPKSIQYIFLLVSIALGVSIYKTLAVTSNTDTNKTGIQHENKIKTDSINNF